MSEEEKSRARCEAHDMAYDPAVHTGCILCRREEPDEDAPGSAKKSVLPYVVAIALIAIAISGIGLGVYGHRTQRAVLDDEGQTEPVERSDDDAMPDEPPEATLMLGRAGVDQYGYPYDLPDKLTLTRWLLDRRYKTLTEALESLEDEADGDVHKEHWPSVAFSAFGVADRRLGRRFDGWIKSAPKSFAPYLARAAHRVALARHYRERAGTRPPSKKRQDKSRKLLSLASKDVDQALLLRPDAVDAYALRLAIATDTGSDVADRTQIVEEAVQHCTHCVGPRASYLGSISPSHGGSHDLMKKKAEGWQYVSENPKLRQLLGYVDADLCRDLRGEDPERALTHCERALRTGRNADFLAEKARVLVELEQYDAAAESLDEALSIRPQRPDVIADRALILLALERYEDAARDFALAVRLDPSDTESKVNLNDILDKLVRAAYYQAEAGEVDDAIANYDRVLEMHPRYADALAYRGVAYAKKDELDRAERDLLRAIKIDPKNLEAYRGLDAVLFRQKRLDEMISHWNRYLRRRPKDATALFKRSGAHYHKGQMELAMRDVKAACRLGNDEACATQRRFAVAP